MTKKQNDRFKELLKTECGAFMVTRSDGITIKSFATTELAEEAAKLLSAYHGAVYSVTPTIKRQEVKTSEPVALQPSKELRRAERELVKEYRWRQRRYSENHNGIRARGNNCWNEGNMANTITRLENLVDELGGDTRACLVKARELEDAKR